MMTNMQSSAAVNLSLPDTYHHTMTRRSDSTLASSEAEEIDGSESSERELFVKTKPRHHNILRICYSCNSNWPATVCLWFTYAFVSVAYSVIDPFFPSEVFWCVHNKLKLLAHFTG